MVLQKKTKKIHLPNPDLKTLMQKMFLMHGL